MRKRNAVERVISFILALVLTFSTYIGNVGTAYASEAGNEESSTATSEPSNEGSETGGNSSLPTPLSDSADQPTISIDLEWMDSEFKNGTAFNLQEDSNVSNTVTLNVSYSSSQVQEKGYQPGDLIITVKGIGNVNRSGTLEAVVGADKEDAETKIRDWTYTWNKANDTYTFTNNEEIKGNSVLSGYFELVWEIKARDSIHGYTQAGIQAEIYFPEGGSMQTQELSFSNETKADTFAVYIARQEMYSYEGLTAGIENPDDYAFVRYNLGTDEFENSRGLKSEYFTFNPDASNTGSGAIVISPNLSCENNGDGTYAVKLHSYFSMTAQYLFVAYPKTQYAEKTVTASIEKYGAYHEGDDNGNTDVQQLAIATIDVAVPIDFHFTDPSGDVYDYWKDVWYDKINQDEVEERGGDVVGSKLVSGTSETFYLEGVLNNPHGIGYTLELVDDFIYILKNNAEYRQLGVGEYSIAEIGIPSNEFLRNLNGIPIAEETYPVMIYTAKNGELVDTTKDPVFTGTITTENQDVALPEGTTAVAIVLKDLKESIREFRIPVRIDFHIKDTSGLENAQQDNLTNGQVVNTTFIKLYDEDGNWINTEWTDENYKDETNLGLAQKDLDTYGAYLDRERDNFTLYASEKVDYYATTDIGPITVSGSSFATTLMMGARFYFERDVYPNHFSLYTILPEFLSLQNYKIKEDIWDIMELSGLDLSEKALADACTPEVITDYNGSGRTYIALHFDFGDQKVSQDSQIWADFKLKLDREFLKTSRSVNVRSAVIIDNAVDEYNIGKSADIGAWGDNKELFQDIDRDEDTDEILSSNYDFSNYVYADSSQLQLSKYVSTTYSDGWVQLPDVPYEEYGASYQYNLSIRNGNSKASNIVVTDVLEVGENAQWQGTFQSVDLSKCEDVGLTGTVYYSASSSPSPLYDEAGILNAADWSTTKPDTVKAISVDFGAAVLNEGEELNILVNMKAPEDVSLKGEITENGFSASFVMYDSGSGDETEEDDLASNLVQVILTPALKTIVVTKKDAENGAKLSGAVFTLVNKETGETVAQLTSNERGYAIFRDIPSDAAYVIQETQAPTGYIAGEAVEVDLTDSDAALYITVENARKTGRIEVYKVNNLITDVPVAGAEYTLAAVDGSFVEKVITDENGRAVFENITWGSYIVKETVSPAGYQLNETEYPVEVNQETVEKSILIQTADVQDDVYVHLVKYAKTVGGEPTEIPLGGATFELLRVTEEGTRRLGLYVTDKDGRIDITDLPYGTYRFQEYRTPAGYLTAENAEFTLSPDNKEVNVTVYDQRKPGSVIITKKDNLGNSVQGIGFTLYGEDKETEVITVMTDDAGVAEINDLEWGTYYLRETSAPDYYTMNTEWKQVVISGSSLTAYVHFVNETVKGTVVLTKTDESGQNLLPGAEYTLYTIDGTVLGTYVTGAKDTENEGKIIVEGLEWGSYYFKETKAPAGYNLSGELVRFSVNALNAGVTQHISVTDPLDARTITLTKCIFADEINFANGAPTFIFKVEGVDVNDASHTYYRSVTFDEAFVKNYTDANGCVTQSVTITGLTAGNYTASEIDTSRYKLAGISDVLNGTINGETAELDVENYKEAAAAFTNRKYEWQDFSDNQNLTNIVKEQTKLTALKVTYGSTTAEASSAVDTSILTVIAIYDDGSTKELTESQYVLSPATFPNVNGDYQVTVSYTENGITRSDSFTVTLFGMKSYIVSLEASTKDDVRVLVGSEVTSGMFDVEAIYNDGHRETLQGHALPVTITSPNWPSNYPASMTEANNYWEQTFEGASSIQITFDSTSKTEGGWDYISIYDSEGTQVHKLSGSGFWQTTRTVSGSYVKIAMSSDGSYQYKGFSATLTPVYDGEAEYTVSPATAPATAGSFDVTISLNLDVIPNDGRAVSTTASAVARYPEPILESGADFNADVPDTATAVVFTKNAPPAGAETIDVSAAGNGSVLAWLDGTTFYVAAKAGGEKVIANTSCRGLLQDKSNLISADLSMLDTSNTTDMYGLFMHCSALESVNVSGWDTSKATYMYGMFHSCEKLTNLDLSHFVTDNVTSLAYMFYDCAALQSLKVNGWNTSKVEDMDKIFDSCSSLTTLDISSWDTYLITDMENLFSYCSSLTSIKFGPKWTTENVTTMYLMFKQCSALKELDVSNWNTSKVTSMYQMFEGCSSLEVLDVANWDVSSVGSIRDMFYECSSLKELDLSKWDTGGLYSDGLGSMFYCCSDLTSVKFGPNWDVSMIENMYGVFGFCNSLTSLDLTYWNTSSCTRTSDMFADCTNLSSITFGPNWSMTNVEMMDRMFSGCSSLTSLDVSGWDTSSAWLMQDTFYECSKLVADCSKWNVTNVTRHADFNYKAPGVIAPTWVS